MKYFALLILISFLKPLKSQKIKNDFIVGKYIFNHVNTNMSRNGLMYAGIGKLDSSGRGWAFSLGFPLYKVTYGEPYYCNQIYQLGGEVKHSNKYFVKAKKSTLNYATKFSISTCKEGVRNSAYQKADSLYFYEYFNFKATRLNLIPHIDYRRSLGNHFYIELNVGLCFNASYLKFNDLHNSLPSRNYGVPVDDKTNEYSKIGWNYSLRPFGGTKLIYQLHKK